MKRKLIHLSAYSAVKSAPRRHESFYEDRKEQGYVLTFRCINCGKHGVLAQYPSDGMESEQRIRARIYQVSCNSCGWTGDACGLSAIRISHTTELKARAAGQGPGL